jgi:hypothetical protein
MRRMKILAAPGLKTGIPVVHVMFLHTHILSTLHSSRSCLQSSMSESCTDQISVQTGPDMLAILRKSGITSIKSAKPSIFESI